MAFLYSCCFWFSLRLGGILIGIFSIVQAVPSLICLCIALNEPQDVKDQISMWTRNVNLIHVNEFFESFQADPEKYLTYSIVVSSIYLFVSILYIYGAYTCNNTAMIGYILVEFLRLITLSIFVILALMVLKHNTMDIGLVIGASVAGGFIILGMFYLWACAANLPILINEMEREEQAATIERLQRLLENKDLRFKSKHLSSFENENLYTRQLFHITND